MTTALPTRQAFDQRFKELYPGDAPLLSDVDLAAFRAGDIEYFEKKIATQKEEARQHREAQPKVPAFNQFDLGDLSRLETQYSELIQEEARFKRQQQTVKSHERELNVKEKAAKEILQEFEGVAGRDAAWNRRQAQEALTKVAEERADWARQKERSTRWLAAVQARIEGFPQDELLRLRKLAKKFDQMRQGIERNKRYGQD